MFSPLDGGHIAAIIVIIIAAAAIVIAAVKKKYEVRLASYVRKAEKHSKGVMSSFLFIRIQDLTPFLFCYLTVNLTGEVSDIMPLESKRTLAIAVWLPLLMGQR